jgi:stringent starvation protein B
LNDLAARTFITMLQTSADSPSTRPYLIRALHEWCSDNGLTPFLVVKVDGTVQVPREFVQNGEIVLNVGYDATNKLQLGNDYIEFHARFGGKSREIMVPIAAVAAIYAKENGQGMAFPVSGKSNETDAAAVNAPARATPAAPLAPPDRLVRTPMQLVASKTKLQSVAPAGRIAEGSVIAADPSDVENINDAPKSPRPGLIRIK